MGDWSSKRQTGLVEFALQEHAALENPLQTAGSHKAQLQILDKSPLRLGNCHLLFIALSCSCLRGS